MRILLFAVAICSLLAACGGSSPGAVHSSADNPLVTIGAGSIKDDDLNSAHAWYVIDTRTRTCWIRLGDGVGAMDCCHLRRVKQARKAMPWVDKERCAAQRAINSRSRPKATPPPSSTSSDE